jgi:hypothetical protein
LRPRLHDARDGLPEVLVCRDGFILQSFQRRIVENAPPLRVSIARERRVDHEIAGLRVIRLESRRRRHARAGGISILGAGRGRQRDAQNGRNA